MGIYRFLKIYLPWYPILILFCSLLFPSDVKKKHQTMLEQDHIAHSNLREIFTFEIKTNWRLQEGFLKYEPLVISPLPWEASSRKSMRIPSPEHKHKLVMFPPTSKKLLLISHKRNPHLSGPRKGVIQLWNVGLNSIRSLSQQRQWPWAKYRTKEFFAYKCYVSYCKSLYARNNMPWS